ncbi:sugar phosphate isomerase/epimerase family protein [Bryobacter aggregatus]|uniref:sugar phosphate isomerase/epimerase family protein n=1 Tax=Bryobacter aggregatus TaxID=360054 RepID=UPI0004E25142|nr:sugar phosphate isomerase/epimerase [Bryobacter aggregatus]
MSALLSRRNLLASSAAAILPLQAKTLKTFGAQLYTLRSIINEKPLEVLQQLEALGFTEVEAIRGNLAQIWDSLKQTKLKPVSLHMDTSYFFKDIEKLNPALDDAKSKGFEYIVCPYIAPADRGGVEVIKKLADTLNKTGQRVKAAGMKLCYHNHAFEFEPVAGTQDRLLDVLMREADKSLVGLELDIMWAQVGGVPPEDVFAKYKGRIPLVHLKNVSKIAPQYNERVKKEDFQTVGGGVINIPSVLKAATAAGTKHFFVEQDQTPGNPLDSLKQSAEYLKKLNF